MNVAFAITFFLILQMLEELLPYSFQAWKTEVIKLAHILRKLWSVYCVPAEKYIPKGKLDGDKTQRPSGTRNLVLALEDLADLVL